MKRLAIGGGLALGALALTLYLLDRNSELVEIKLVDHEYRIWQPVSEAARIQESGK